ncbi:MAG: hypothetical protein LBJ31_10295 [Treponema sp.]|nr:hypothetical protein [Treponema sp.]
MKKAVVLVILFVLISLPVSAQGFYFDIGLGFGKGWTKVEGVDMVDALNDAGAGADEIAVDIGLKAGYGPFGNIPLYVVGELAGMGHRIYDSSNYIQFSSYIIGPGVIFYPIPLIQLGLSAGYSFVSNKTDMPMTMYDSKSGFAWNVSAAVDLGRRNHGCLIGLKYFNANNTLKTSNADEKASMVSIFIKYAYRKKAPSLF